MASPKELISRPRSIRRGLPASQRAPAPSEHFSPYASLSYAAQKERVGPKGQLRNQLKRKHQANSAFHMTKHMDGSAQ